MFILNNIIIFVEVINQLLKLEIMDVEDLHELARLFMYQFAFEPMSLDEWLSVHSEDLTDDERNLGYYILKQFDKF